MLPNLIPIITVLGLMGWIGIHIDMFTMLIGSIAIGITVDDTVHFVYNFRKYFSQCGDAFEAVRHTLQTTGRAMLGSSINIAKGNWLIKGETAYLDGLEYFIDIGKKQRLDILVGAEYTGFSETVFSFELVNRHIFSFDDRLKQAPVYGQEDELQSALRLSRDFLNDTLQLTLLLSTFDLKGEDGSFQRISAQYDWSDSVRLTAGGICYQSGNNALFKNIGANDRLFAEIRYSF